MNNNYARISDTLKVLGISANLSGYRYIRCAIELAMEDMDLLHHITKGIYPEIALRFKTTSSRVERAIRHAIETGWVRCDLDVAEKIFGYTVDANKAKPTNGEFIATVADYLLYSQEE